MKNREILSIKRLPASEEKKAESAVPIRFYALQT
jgi:hypothetical protein